MATPPARHPDRMENQYGVARVAGGPRQVSALVFMVRLWSAMLHADVTGGLASGGTCQGVRAGPGRADAPHEAGRSPTRPAAHT